MSTELAELLASKSNLTKTTLNNYQSYYKKITEKTGQPLKDLDEDMLIDVIKEISTNPSNQDTYITLPILIKKLYGLEHNKLTDFRKQLKPQISKHTETVNQQKGKDLPKFKELENHLKTLYDEKKHMEYIINYILINYGTRNKDLDLFITKYNKAEKYENDINYMIVYKSRVDIIINNYKTYKIYGPKYFKITNKKFIEVANQLPLESWLLKVESGEHIRENSLNTFIQRRLYKNLCESDYFKMLILHLMNKKNAIQNIQKFSATRGTDFKTILESYNIYQK